MKLLLNHLRSYITDNFTWPIYLFTAAWLVLIFSINYSLDLEDSVIDALPSYAQRLAGFVLFHLTPFIVPAAFIAYYSKSNALANKAFWSKVLVAILMLAAYRSLQLYDFFCSNAQINGCQYWYRVFGRFIGLFMMLTPLILFFRVDKKYLKSFYGLDFRFASIRAYLPMLGIMAVGVFIAALISDDLQSYYPVYKRSGGPNYAVNGNIPQWKTVLLFEASYLFNFLSIEFFFRGFFILALVRLFGPHIVLPVACLYASIHFGKPMLEALGSIFGGYILGILTLKTENIWGGFFLHAGTALFMELFAWLI